MHQVWVSLKESVCTSEEFANSDSDESDEKVEEEVDGPSDEEEEEE